MCGIAGIFGLSETQNQSAIMKMVRSISHRGPDRQNKWCGGKMALGHSRLSIIDLSEEANQPMKNHSGRYVIVFNGEVYNFKEIKSKLPDYPFKSDSDTEVVLAAFIRWGEDCLEQLNGMFAFAIWDKVEEELFVARDRLGIKPFYYYHQDNIFVFASEIRALLKSGFVPRKLSKSGIQDYLTYQTVHAPYSIIKDVFQLLPGQFGFFRGSKLNKKMYWDIKDQGNTVDRHWEYNSVKKDIKNLMFKAVERRMISDVPLGAFLSGGIDSSAIVAIMANLSSVPINTFSIVFDEKKFDESVYSSLIARKYQTNHTQISLKPTDFLDDLPSALRSMDVPSSDGVNTFSVAKATKNAGITVALSGLGGDELFIGYPIYNQWYSLHKKKAFWKLPVKLRSYAGRLMSLTTGDHRSDRIEELMEKPSFSFEEIFPVFRKVMTKNDFKELAYQYQLTENNLEKQLAGTKDQMQGKPIFSQSSIGDISSYTQNILLRDADQMGMASALEIRVPFFDHHLIEYVLGVPDHIKHPTYPKKILVEALSPLLPNEIVHRKKMGFTFPWESWLKNELRPFCEKNIAQLNRMEIFQDGELNNYWNRFLSGDKRVTWVKVWLLVVLSNWLTENNIEQA